MPTYSYSCKDCGHAFDIQQAFSDDALTVCPNCSGALRKVFSAVGVVFKGSGFYRTDSRGSGSSTTTSTTTSSASSNGTGSSSNGTGSSSSSSSSSSTSSTSSSTSSTGAA
ncbi:FmdB family zinc ribbon protein [Ornithinimicrobium humiphilum]|uniref:FmdB family zinc ribbon protein n=1 Tax=Ornithinimicrobium humiphilum TaxID=125288 RepID=UPI001153A0B0|nr:FmdB family zinc ribbon protein [Ornithinimicrobium humiphilum]